MKSFHNICCHSLNIVEITECSVTLSRRKNNINTILINFLNYSKILAPKSTDSINAQILTG